MPPSYNDPNWYDNYLHSLLNPASAAGAGQPRPAAAIQPLPEQDEQSLLGSITDKALGGLGYVGKVLDKGTGARAVRGIAGGLMDGDPMKALHEAASVIPFSDSVGLTNEKNTVHGRDLLEKAGAVDAPQPGLEWGDVAGLGVDILTDPASWLTTPLGALTKVGGLAKKAGTLEKTIGGRIAAGQGGLVGTGGLSNLLGMGEHVAGTGPMAQNVAGYLDQGIGKLGNLPGMNYAKQLFSKAGGDTSNSILQQGYKDVFMPTLEKENASALGDFIGNFRSAQEAGVKGPELEGILRSSGEGVLPAGPLRPAEQQAAQLGRDMAARQPGELQRLQGYGFPTPEFESVTPQGQTLNFMPGYHTPLPPEPGQSLLQRATTSHGALPDVSRNEAWRNLPTDVRNSMSTDPELRGLLDWQMDPSGKGLIHTPNGPSLEAENLLRERYLNMGPAERTDLANLKSANPDARIIDPITGISNPNPDFQKMQSLQGRFDQAPDLANLLREFDPRQAGQQIPSFRNSPFVDEGMARLANAKKIAEGEMTHHVLATNPVPIGTPNSVPLAQVMQSLGLTHEEGLKSLAARMNLPIEDLGKLSLDKDLAEAMVKRQQISNSPEYTKPMLAMIDQLTNAFKAGVTLPHPGFQIRNLAQGAVQAWVTGSYYPGVMASVNPMAHLEPFLDAAKIAKGEAVPGAAERFFKGMGLTDEVATKQLADEMFMHKVAGNQRDLNQVGGMMAGLPQEPLSTVLPGSAEAVAKFSPRELIPRMDSKASFLEDVNPLNVRGLLGNTETKNVWMKQAENAQEQIEFMNRGSTYLAKRAQGYVPEEAAAISRAAHNDYSQLSSFERNTMRRVIPFYSWSRRNLPFVVDQMLENPAKETALIRAGTERGQGEFTPGYIGEGVALPLPGAPEGQQRYLSSLGLPVEDEWIKALGSAAHGQGSRALAQLAGGLNPLLKYPLETATGVQLHSGRNLADLRPSAVGSGFGMLSEDVAHPLSQLLSNTPLSRGITGIDKLLDPRKGWGETLANLGTGGRVSDVDMTRQKEIAARSIIEEMLRGHEGVGTFQRQYVKPEDISKLSQEDLALMRLQTGLEKKAKERNKLAR